jgi:hypothetical protein
MKKSTKPEKKIEKYLVEHDGHDTSLEHYSASPARAFLLQVCEAYDAFHMCESKFQKKQDGSHYSDAQDSLEVIAGALLASLMGHFETYQRSLFAGLLDRSSKFEKFSIADFLKRIEEAVSGKPELQWTSLLAFRGQNTQIGFVVADSLHGWHNPVKVNKLFQSLSLSAQVFSNEHISDIRVLWQLRHSIVHTGAWLTPPDAQKVERLRAWSNKPIAFERTFTLALCRKLHKIVATSNRNIETAAIKALGNNSDASAKKELSDFLRVASPKTDWLA